MGELIQAINLCFDVIGWCLLVVFGGAALICFGVYVWQLSWDAAVERHFARRRIEIANSKQANPHG